MTQQNYLSPTEIRHALHQNPELSLKEFKTTQLLKDNIKLMSLAHNIDIEILSPLETGLIAVYRGNPSCINYNLFRGDIDGLPISEKTNCPYQSKNQNMHACGHDVHASILYGFLEETLKNKYKKNILFLFQPAEEDFGGAKLILDTNILDKFNITQAYAIHVTDEYNEGSVATKAGTLFASATGIDIHFIGKNSHVAFPHKGRNAFKALQMFLDIFEKIDQNPTDPLVLNFGKISAGDVRNVLPSFAKLEGDLRATSVKKGNEVKEQIISILNSIPEITKVKTEFQIISDYGPVVNDQELYNKISPLLKKYFTFIECELKMTGEDFGFISNKYPSLMFWLGTKNENGEKGLHNPEFLPKDSVIEHGIHLFQIIISNE